MKRFFCLPLVFAFFLSGCMSDNHDTIVLPEPEQEGELPSTGGVPSSVIPNEIRNKFEQSMPLHTGTTPPDISGQYMVNNFTLVGSSLNYDEIGGGGYADMYVAFIKGAKGKLSYRERQGSSESGSDDVTVEIVGSNNNFTAYFITTGVSSGISTKRSTVISGTLTNSGIRNFHYAFIMLEKGSDPSHQLVEVNTYRIFKDGDGSAEKYTWR